MEPVEMRLNTSKRLTVAISVVMNVIYYIEVIRKYQYLNGNCLIIPIGKRTTTSISGH
jgi:hypothetical protein